MNPADQLFWDSLTVQFVDEAILQLDSETLIETLRARIEKVCKEVPSSDIVQAAEHISRKVGQVLVDLYGEDVDIDVMVLLLEKLQTASEQALRQKSVLGFVASIQAQVSGIFQTLATPKPVVIAEKHVPVLPITSAPLLPVVKKETDGAPEVVKPEMPTAKKTPGRQPLKHIPHENDSGDILADEKRAEEEARRGGYESSFKSYMKGVTKFGLLTREEEIELAEKIKKGDETAREKMIVSNLRLVVKIAFDYGNYGMDVKDLIQEGNIGLMKAVERFDPGFGSKFSTYAAWWIKQSIKRALANQSRDIRLPVHLVDKISKMKRVAHALTEELGREPTDDEIAEEIGIEREAVYQLRTIGMRPASLDAEIGNEPGGTTLGDMVGDGKEDASEVIANADMLSKVLPLLDCLDEREREIIERRFGLNGRKAQTLEEVGEIFGVTRERIRQLQNIALGQMRRTLEKKDKNLPRTVQKKKKKDTGPVNGKNGKKHIQVSPSVRLQTNGNSSPGKVFEDNAVRFMISALYNGTSGTRQHDIAGIAQELELPPADIYATLKDLRIDLRMGDREFVN